MRVPRVVAAALFIAGCSDATAPRAERPHILTAAVAANPDNVLSAIVSVRLTRADSMAVRFAPAGTPLLDATPAVLPTADSAVALVLGLLPEMRYALQVVAWGGGRSYSGDILTFTTGALPEDLPSYDAAGSDPAPGYVVFAAGSYGIVIDNDGRVVWYHRFPNGPGLNFQPQPNGRYTARPLPTNSADPAAWVEIDLLGRVTRSFGCAGGLQPRFHDMIARPDGSYWILCDETRIMDLSAIGGVAAARVTGTVVQHVGADGEVLFEWSPFGHFAIEDLPATERTGTDVNWTHGNALDLDADGNLLVSFRSLSEVTRVDTRTGGVLWRMGGLANQFVFTDRVGSSEPAFSGQHGVRITGPHELLLLDNLGNDNGTRAERYAYDTELRLAEQIASYGSSPSVIGQLGGSTQQIADGHVLVAFGNGGRVEEYDAAGRMVWRIEQPGYVFRAYRIRSLYGGPGGFATGAGG